MTVAWLLTTNYPPVGGGVSRYNAGLVSVAGGSIVVAGIDGFAPPPPGEGIRARLQQIWWARGVSQGVPSGVQILVSPPHLAVGVVMAGKPFVQFIHGGEWEGYPFGGFFLNRLLRVARQVVVSSEATQHRWLSPKISSKVLVMRPGLSAVTPVVNRRARTHSGQSTVSGAFRVVAVARLSVRKGFERLIGAVKFLHAAGEPIELRIVGSGNMESELKALTTNAPYIVFDTAVSDEELLQVYDSADLFALVPREVKGGEAWEGFGIVYLEAAARGLPIVATRFGGIPEAVCPEGSKMLDEQCLEDEIAAAIRELMSDPTRLARMSDANSQWAAGNSWESRRELVEQILRPGNEGRQ